MEGGLHVYLPWIPASAGMTLNKELVNTPFDTDGLHEDEDGFSAVADWNDIE